MRRDHKPYTVHLLINFIRDLYTRWRLVPQFETVGTGLYIIGPQRLEIYGANISLGDNVHIQTTRGHMSRLCTWPDGEGGNGRITIGNHTLLTPGLQIVSAASIMIGNNVMIASRAYISDADWHGIYDRLASPGACAPIHIGDNVWLGEGVKICKGVTIGENTVIGAGAVVTKNIAADVIAAGNPARVVRELDKTRMIVKRETMYENPEKYNKAMSYLHYLKYKDNSYMSWIRHLAWPSKKD